MKTKKLLQISTLVLLLMFIGNGLNAQWQQDTKFGFKIKIPTNWNKNSYMDGTDKVYDYMSADENIAIQLRAFDAGAGFTTALLAQVYEESMLPAGTQKISLNDHTTANGIPSKKGVYLIDYNGTEVGLSALYIVQNNKGYVLTALIPTSMIQQKGAELKQIVKSFSIDGYSASTLSAKQNKPSGLSGLSAGMTSNTFKIIDIKLTSQIDVNDNAINPSNRFSTNTREIFAVINYKGDAKNDLVVSWIYNDWNRTISTDKFVFTNKSGGIGVVSMTKPNSGWPVGNYSVKFEMNGNLLSEKKFNVTEQSKNTGSLVSNTSTNSNIIGKYNLLSRSDGKSLVEYHFIKIDKNGTYWEEYSPKNSGGYVSESAGTWKVNGNELTLTQRYGGVSESYTIKGNEIIRTSEQGTVFIFRK